jgi:hypothetical protein
MLDNLEPAKKIKAPSGFRPGLEFDGNEGVATTEGLPDAPNFDEFLEQRGYSPDEYEIVGTPRTSQWQRWDGEWLTSYRFHFRRKVTDFDLPTLYSQAKKTKATLTKQQRTDRAYVICPADFQIGKTGSRGSTEESIQRIQASYKQIEKRLKAGNYDRIVIIDAGDVIEGVSNKADMEQAIMNSLSPMQQVDLAAALLWDLIKMATKYAPVTYGTVASNHCQYRVQKQHVGRPGVDDWGIVILQQLKRLANEVGLPVERWLIPQPHDEGFAFQVFEGDDSHILGAIHGHQVSNPNGFPNLWKSAVFGSSYLAAASICVTGHFHHCRVQELGGAPGGGSRWWVQASTSDNGSDWFRRTSMEDSSTGITCFELVKGQPFRGSVEVL